MDKTVTPSNLSTLTQAVNTYLGFAVANTIEAIDAIGEVDLTETKKTLIENALVAYDMLSDEQALQVTNYDKLTQAVEKYNKFYNFALVNNSIVETELDNPVSLKETIDLYNSLTAEEKEALECKNKMNEIMIKYVTDLINSIPDTVTSANGALIDEASKQYNSLSNENKEAITNYSKLEGAIVQFEAIAAARRTLDFNGKEAKGDEFFTVAGTLKTGMSAVTYEGTIYNYALKLDSKGKITFTAASDDTTLVIVTDSSSVKIKVNDEVITPDSNGIITTKVNKGTVTIAKGSGEGHIYLVIVG